MIFPRQRIIYLKERREYSHLKEEALDCTLEEALDLL
jgi:hypothetical protein